MARHSSSSSLRNEDAFDALNYTCNRGRSKLPTFPPGSAPIGQGFQFSASFQPVSRGCEGVMVDGFRLALLDVPCCGGRRVSGGLRWV
jgi:hypothetical protein